MSIVRSTNLLKAKTEVRNIRKKILDQIKKQKPTKDDERMAEKQVHYNDIVDKINLHCLYANIILDTNSRG
jgi:ribosome recycling factor